MKIDGEGENDFQDKNNKTNKIYINFIKKYS